MRTHVLLALLGPSFLLSGLLSGCTLRAAKPDTKLTPAPEVMNAAQSVAADPSPGCTRSVSARGGWYAISSGGRERRYLLRLPKDPAKPMPLVFNFHGWLEPAAMQETYTFMTDEATERGIAVVYPQGIGYSWNAGQCCGRAVDEHIDDMAFVRAMLEKLEGELCIDRSRVYSTGMSNGAMMSFKLACEMSDTFAAVAPVDGAEAVPECTPKRPVPVLAFNGKWDTLVWYGGGGPGGFPSIAECTARWTKRNGCSEAVETVYAKGEATCVAAKGCGADVQACSVDYGGHTWPGGAYFPLLGHTTGDLDATRSIIDFFLAHPMPKPSR